MLICHCDNIDTQPGITIQWGRLVVHFIPCLLIHPITIVLVLSITFEKGKIRIGNQLYCNDGTSAKLSGALTWNLVPSQSVLSSHLRNKTQRRQSTLAILKTTVSTTFRPHWSSSLLFSSSAGSDTSTPHYIMSTASSQVIIDGFYEVASHHLGKTLIENIRDNLFLGGNIRRAEYYLGRSRTLLQHYFPHLPQEDQNNIRDLFISWAFRDVHLE